MTARTALLTIVAMIAFAANSLLCRLALGAALIDPASFATVRVISGALILGILVVLRDGDNTQTQTDWRAVAALFGYMIFFSFAYLSLGAGTGALILFGAVQLTMFIFAMRGGEYFPPLSWAGLALAAGGLVYLVSSGVTAPNIAGALLMTVAGISWGVYSLRGKLAAEPLRATARNFLFCVPAVLLVSVVTFGNAEFSLVGITLAAASGAVASGLGYAIWYAALSGLSAGRAATVQLSVPVIAAFGGVLLLGEAVTVRLLIASAATLGGVAVVLLQRAKRV
jgi:drug/metabolite transporter (DMT)-like permease